jgi:hypothetical protein
LGAGGMGWSGAAACARGYSPHEGHRLWRVERSHSFSPPVAPAMGSTQGALARCGWFFRRNWSRGRDFGGQESRSCEMVAGKYPGSFLRTPQTPVLTGRLPGRFAVVRGIDDETNSRSEFSGRNRRDTPTRNFRSGNSSFPPAGQLPCDAPTPQGEGESRGVEEFFFAPLPRRAPLGLAAHAAGHRSG